MSSWIARWPEGRGDPLQRLQVGIGDSPFEPAHDHAAKARPTGEFDPSPATSFAERLDVDADPGALFLESSFHADGEGASPDAGHDRCMFILSACPALTRHLPGTHRPARPSRQLFGPVLHAM
jgi:hypothetical protein